MCYSFKDYEEIGLDFDEDDASGTGYGSRGQSRRCKFSFNLIFSFSLVINQAAATPVEIRVARAVSTVRQQMFKTWFMIRHSVMILFYLKRQFFQTSILSNLYPIRIYCK
jgi:hypothetical protein